MYALFPPTVKIECDASPPPFIRDGPTHTKCGVWFLLLCLFFRARAYSATCTHNTSRQSAEALSGLPAFGSLSFPTVPAGDNFFFFFFRDRPGQDHDVKLGRHQRRKQGLGPMLLALAWGPSGPSGVLRNPVVDFVRRRVTCFCG